MNVKQPDPASSTCGNQFLSHGREEDESSVAAELRILMDSAETQSLVRDLMSDDRYLQAQISGLNQGAVSREVPSHHPGPSYRPWSHPIPNHQGFSGEFPTRQPTGSRQTRSPVPMEAQAPFTPTEPAGVMRRGAPAGYPPTASSQPTPIPFQYQQHDQQGLMRHIHPKSILPAAPWPYPNQTPSKRGFIGNARKPKTTFSLEQLELLEMTFAARQYPSSVLRKQLAYVSGLPQKTVQTWFQNARVRFRRKQKHVSKNPKQSPSSKPSSEEPSPVKSVSESEGSNEMNAPSPSESNSGSQAPQVQPSSRSPRPVPSCPESRQMESCADGVSPDTPSPTHAFNQGHPPTTPMCRPFDATCPSPKPEFLLVFPPPEQAFRQPASPRQNSLYPPPNQSQQAGRPLLSQTPPSTEWYHPRQQHLCLPPSYCEAGASWAFPNPGASNLSNLATPSREFIPTPAVPNMPQYDYRYFPLRHPGSAEPTFHNWEMIYPNLPQHSMATNQQQQQQVATSLAASLDTPVVEIMPSQCQHPGLLMMDSNKPGTASCMVPRRSGHIYAHAMQNINPYMMPPQPGSNPQGTQSFATSNSNLQHGFSSANPTPALPSDHSQAAHPQDYRSYPSSVLQHGFPKTYSAPALPSDDGPSSQPQQNYQSFPDAISQVGFSDQNPTQAVRSDYRPCSHPNEDPQIIPSANSINQGVIADEHPTMQCRQLLHSATQPINPDRLASSSDSQLQFPARQVPTPKDLVHACDHPLMSAAVESSSQLLSPASDSSLGSCNTLYIDMDAGSDGH